MTIYYRNNHYRTLGMFFADNPLYHVPVLLLPSQNYALTIHAWFRYVQ